MFTHVSLPPGEPRHHLVMERHRRGWSQQYLADSIGTTQLNVSRWERGYTTPNPYFRSRLCHFFGLTAVALGLEPGITNEVLPLLPFAERRNGEMASPPLYDPTILLPVTPLVGREHELAHLKNRLLSDEQVSSFALHGLPGVGKTALVLKLVADEEIQAHFSQGMLWAALGPQPDILAILRRWGRLLGVSDNLADRLHTMGEWMEEVQTRIAMQRLLIVLDDVWDLDVAMICKVIGPRCVHVITTRLPQVALAFAPEEMLTVEELQLSEGMLLLRQLAPEVVEGEYEQIQSLAETAGGLPMALALIGNYLRLQSHSGQSRRIHTALARLLEPRERLRLSVASVLLKSPSRALEPAISLEATIARSEQYLSLQARAALTALSVFPSKPASFSEEAALAVSQVSAGVLDELSDAGLIESVASGRYSLHRTITDYAHNHLSSDDPIDRLITYGMHFLTAHAQDCQALDKERAVLLAALDAAYQHKYWAAFIRGARVFISFLLSQGDTLSAEQQVARACKAVLALDDQIGQEHSM